MFKISKTSRLVKWGAYEVMSKSLNHDFSYFANYHSHDKGGIIWFYIKSFSKSEKFRESFEGTNFKI